MTRQRLFVLGSFILGVLTPSSMSFLQGCDGLICPPLTLEKIPRGTFHIDPDLEGLSGTILIEEDYVTIDATDREGGAFYVKYSLENEE